WALLYFPTGDGEGGSYPERIAVLKDSIETETKAIGELTDLIKGGKDESWEGKYAEARIERYQLDDAIAPTVKQIRELELKWKRQTILGQLGQAIEPAVRPLGWDWRIGVATLASFPAREVVVGTLGIVYQVGKVESDDLADAEDVSEHDLSKALRNATWE